MKFREFLVWARKLREAEIGEYRREFKNADPDGSGKLDTEEIENVLTHLGYTPLRCVIKDMLKEFDQDKEGQLDFDEFVNMMEVNRRTDGFSKELIAEMQATFKLFDPKGLGEVGVLQVAEILRYMGYNVELEEAESYVKAVDFNGNDSLDFREFLRLMRLHREERLTKLKEAFRESCDSLTQRISQSAAKNCLNKLGLKISGPLLAAFVAGVENSDTLDFDDFVTVSDNCRRLIINKTRRQANFLDEEVQTFEQAFKRYDIDSSGDITRKEMNVLVGDLGIEIRTVDDQNHFLGILVEARSSAKKAGIAKEDVGDQNTGITFWTFIHLLRQCQTREDIKKAHNLSKNKHTFSTEQFAELEGVFNHWLERAAKDAGFKTDEDSESEAESECWSEAESAVSSEQEVQLNPKDKLLPLRLLWKLLRRLGLNVTRTHRDQLQGKIALDKENRLPAALRRRAIDLDGFMRLLTWMLDSNFSSLRVIVEMGPRPTDWHKPVAGQGPSRAGRPSIFTR